MDISNIGGATKILAEIIKDVTGIFIDPIKKMVNSETDLSIAKREAKKQFTIDSLTLLNRTKLRMLETELNRQFNLEEICINAMEYLPENAAPESIDRNWLNFFFSTAQDISEGELKKIWGRILATECHHNSSFSKITLERLKIMSQKDCLKFQELSKKVVFTKNNAIIIKIFLEQEFYQTYNYDFVDFLNISDLGLIYKSEIANITIPPQSYLEINTIDNSRRRILNKSDKDYVLKFYVLSTTGRELIKLFSESRDEIYFRNLERYFSKQKGIEYYDPNIRFIDDNNRYLHDMVD